MGFTANLYKFSKDNRSTGIPSGTGTTVSNIVFKENTSRENPVLKLDATTLNDDYDYNYMSFLGKYYYINDIVMGNNDILELHCKKDPLATYRTQIRNSTQYVVRSTHTADLNGYINDTAYAMTNEVSTAHVIAGDSTWFGSTMGTAVIGVLGPNAGDTTTYYEMSTLTLTALIQTLYGIDVTQQLSIASIELGLLKTLYDPIKYMTSCILLPYAYSSTGNTNTIKTGYIDLPIGSGVSVKKINSNEDRVFTATIAYGNHPQAGTRGHYLNNSPYTQRVLSVLPFGTFNLDCSKLNDYEHKVRLRAVCNKSDGNTVLEVYTIPDSSSNIHNVLFYSNAQLGVHVPLYQSDSIFKQTYSMMGAQVGAVGGVLSGNFASLPGTAMQWCGAVNTAHAPEVHMVGGASGSFIVTSENTPAMDSTYYQVTPIDNNLGVMVCDNKQLSAVPGFNICQNSKIDISGTDADREYIRNIMNTGIIIE